MGETLSDAIAASQTHGGWSCIGGQRRTQRGEESAKYAKENADHLTRRAQRYGVDCAASRSTSNHRTSNIQHSTSKGAKGDPLWGWSGKTGKDPHQYCLECMFRTGKVPVRSRRRPVRKRASQAD